MCGRFQLKKDERSDKLLQALKVEGKPRYSDDYAPGSWISFIHENDKRHINSALWWLLLDHETHKPNYKYPSFNSRSDKLDQPRSLAYKPFRESRCISPATAFAEGLGDGKTYHRIELEDRAIAFGGLFKEHLDRDSGEVVYSASIITLPPLEKWANIHPKSIPLMLDYEDEALIDKWLDPDFKDVEAFNAILKPAIRQTQRVTPIDRPSKWNPVGESYLIS
jgi:putative SOS response-associated peptidase YedK